ncbi:hypothetical protein COCMIDRAFT_1953 [Bipolaris oryzae ATCC 44560]|uniref:NAD-dependent epimerase/dehydratase domain-containing protein n=1 Tax=Bipolaris oryzae ATCC 44560 TaxID=930090 RepID=W7A002_COCMI|nr:uncharacterized protein COCMIDRAFT_1953 [Bipolaris oryzae ATCC 44560]EUC49301.1 hypothetical protein COCMIDRAFT_1953 [Bipolaris oryzae ATCC 44560]
MPTLALEAGTTVFVTGVNGLIGSHITDQLLKRGYNVRGAVRNAEKHQYLVDYFSEKHKGVKLELVNVPDMTIEGCYDDFMQGIDGFIHVAAPISESSDIKVAIPIAVKGAVNALKACAKTPSVKRFVFTSSSIAATFPQPDVEFSIDEDTFNEEALRRVREQGNGAGLLGYAVMKTETEMAIVKWMEENKPSFVLNSILPNVNFSALLIPERQGKPSTIEWAHFAWTSTNLDAFTAFAGPQWYVHTVDCALLHVAALIYNDVHSERIFAFAEPWSYNKMMDIWRKQYPEKEFPENIKGLGEDKMKVPNQRAEELLKRIKGSVWESLEKAVKEMADQWE